jgi:hypothetical protein
MGRDCPPRAQPAAGSQTRLPLPCLTRSDGSICMQLARANLATSQQAQIPCCAKSTVLSEQSVLSNRSHRFSIRGSSLTSAFFVRKTYPVYIHDVQSTTTTIKAKSISYCSSSYRIPLPCNINQLQNISPVCGTKCHPSKGPATAHPSPSP